jgi:hypothetical protein
MDTLIERCAGIRRRRARNTTCRSMAQPIDRGCTRAGRSGEIPAAGAAADDVLDVDAVLECRQTAAGPSSGQRLQAREVLRDP